MPGQSRTEILRAARNRDGGWGYFAGRQSWIEPTALAILALGRDAAASKFLFDCQLPDGSWPANPLVRESHASTALVITALLRTGESGPPLTRAVDWLLGVTGSENEPLFRFAHFLQPKVLEMDPSIKAWPWRPGSASWVEPTAHAVVALRKAESAGISKVHGRAVEGERMILDRRCADGGWNYGNRRVLGHDLPSYPETTGVALHAISRSDAARRSVDRARAMFATERSPLGRAWLAAGLRSHGVAVDLGAPAAPDDVTVTAIEEIAAKGGLA